MTHSPTPWRREGDRVIDADGNEVIATQDIRDQILQAVNAHDVLVAACRAALENLVPGSGLTDQQDKDIDAAKVKIKAALAKAGA